LTGITRQSLKDLWAEVRTECSWKHLGSVVWQNKGFLVLGAGFLVVAGYSEPLTFDPTTPTLTASQLGELVRASAKPLVFTAGFTLTMTLIVTMGMRRETLTSFWDDSKRALRTGMIVTLVFWGGVYATTAAYTTLMASTSTIVLHPSTEHDIPLRKE
jgi:hypothetical protein